MQFLQHELAYRLARQRLSRRDALRGMGAGIGAIGLAATLGGTSAAAAAGSPDPGSQQRRDERRIFEKPSAVAKECQSLA